MFYASRVFAENFGWVGFGFLAVCFLYKINPNPRKNDVAVGKSGAQMPLITPIVSWVGLAVSWEVRRFHNSTWMFSNPTYIWYIANTLLFGERGLTPALDWPPRAVLRQILGKSYPISLDPMWIAHYYLQTQALITDGEELPNIFGSDVYCILLFANPSTYHWRGGATQYILIRRVLHIIIFKPKHFSLMRRSYPICLHPMRTENYDLQAQTFLTDGGGAARYLLDPICMFWTNIIRWIPR